jgi:hypothetical protein
MHLSLILSPKIIQQLMGWTTAFLSQFYYSALFTFRARKGLSKFMKQKQNSQMAIWQILFDFCMSPTQSSDPWPLPDTFEQLKDLIREYLQFTHEFKIVPAGGYHVKDAVSFEGLKSAVNAVPKNYLRPELSLTSPIVLSLNLSIDLKRIKSNKPVRTPFVFHRKRF